MVLYTLAAPPPAPLHDGCTLLSKKKTILLLSLQLGRRTGAPHHGFGVGGGGAKQRWGGGFTILWNPINLQTQWTRPPKSYCIALDLDYCVCFLGPRWWLLLLLARRRWEGWPLSGHNNSRRTRKPPPAASGPTGFGSRRAPSHAHGPCSFLSSHMSSFFIPPCAHPGSGQR